MARQKLIKTSVLLSAERRPLLFLASIDAYRIVWSQYIIDELQRKFAEISWSKVKAKLLFDAISELAEVVDHTQITGGNYDQWLHDLNDHPIMATAIAGRVDYLVTWNTHDFPPKLRFADTTLITPDGFLRLFGGVGE